MSERLHINFIKNTLLSRLIAEFRMTRLSKQFFRHVCLGNLPPLFGSKSKVIVYLHSRYLVDTSLDKFIPWRKFCITSVERAWLKITLKASQIIFVQTSTMEQFARKKYGAALNISSYAFLPEFSLPPQENQHEIVFLYVASFESHKNHKTLIEAWKILKEEGISLKLQLVFQGMIPSEFKKDISELNIELKRDSSRDEIYEFYSRATCLIHPSFFESFGIVLIEATKAGLDIIAPEADYVRDVSLPKETFDPYSAKSIARSVKRYLKISEKAPEIKLPSDFWSDL